MTRWQLVTQDLTEFQSTLPQGEWQMPDKNRFISSYISIHTPARGVTGKANGWISCGHISIHTPARGVTLSKYENGQFIYISIHTPARGVTFFVDNSCQITCYFNPHSRKGSDPYKLLSNNFAIISIHTPARGVTPPTTDNGLHTLYFNPHSRKGSDSTF